MDSHSKTQEGAQNSEYPHYKQLVASVRSDLRCIINQSLQNITGIHDIKMKWMTYWRDIVQKHHVIVDGWPENIIPFANLSTASSNLSKLELLLIRWIRGSTQFRKLSDGEFAEMEESEWFRAACKACGVRKSRSDKGKLRGRQPYPESRSKRLRHYAIKSTEFVDSEDEQDVPAEC